MTEKNLVKVTAEYGGRVTEFENEAALVVVFDNGEEEMEVDLHFSGYTSFNNLALAIAHAVSDFDGQRKGFLNEVVGKLLRIQLFENVGPIGKGE